MKKSYFYGCSKKVKKGVSVPNGKFLRLVSWRIDPFDYPYDYSEVGRNLDFLFVYYLNNTAPWRDWIKTDVYVTMTQPSQTCDYLYVAYSLVKDADLTFFTLKWGTTILIGRDMKEHV